MSAINTLITQDPIWLGPEETIEKAWSAMHEHKVRHLPICKGEKLVGLITQKDLLVNSHNRALFTLPVAEVMVYDVHTITPQTSAREAANLMLEHRVSCLPVLEDGKLVGILTETDFLRHLVSFL